MLILKNKFLEHPNFTIEELGKEEHSKPKISRIKEIKKIRAQIKNNDRKINKTRFCVEGKRKNS